MCLECIRACSCLISDYKCLTRSPYRRWFNLIWKTEPNQMRVNGLSATPNSTNSSACRTLIKSGSKCINHLRTSIVVCCGGVTESDMETQLRCSASSTQNTNTQTEIYSIVCSYLDKKWIWSRARRKRIRVGRQSGWWRPAPANGSDSNGRLDRVESFCEIVNG